MKEILEISAAIVGLVTAVIPLIGRFLDMRKRAARQARQNQYVDRAPPPLRASVAPLRPRVPEPVVLELAEEPEFDDGPVASIQRRGQARQMVKGPGIALIVAGILGMGFNLLGAAYNFIDDFVTPLSVTSRLRETPAPSPSWLPSAATPTDRGSRDETSAAYGIFGMVILSIPCGMAIWAGVNMLRLRNYWLSMAGSIAIMPGACVCCLAGIPVGIWAFVILLRPEVSAAFT